MLIVADENMPHAAEVFGRLGEVRTAPGRAMTPELVREADLLFVRSITKVGAPLLEGSRVRFVGTATIGTDHVDQEYLQKKGIGFASAPGCNAESVAQYIGAALATAAGRLGRALSRCSLGIVGVGHCGSRVERVARALGMEVVLNDPPLARQTGDAKYRSLGELLDCDFLTVHVPLTKAGEDPTWRLIDGDVMERMKPGAVLFNASRGFVVDEVELARRLDAGWLAGAVLDAWENEPRINVDLLRRVMLGTPHIAGYSHDGKVAGTRMVYKAACRFLGRDADALDLRLPPAAVSEIRLDGRHRAMDSVLAEAVLRAYPIQRDDADLRVAASADPAEMGAAFDQRRKWYPLRREFAATRIELANAPAEWSERLAALGFTI